MNREYQNNPLVVIQLAEESAGWRTIRWVFLLVFAGLDFVKVMSDLQISSCIRFDALHAEHLIYRLPRWVYNRFKGGGKDYLKTEILKSYNG